MDGSTPAKPVSKLAQLAAARKAASDPKKGSLAGLAAKRAGIPSVPASDSSAPTAPSLSQRIAASRQAVQPPAASSAEPSAQADEIPALPTSALFTFAEPLQASLPQSSDAPSAFFDIIAKAPAVGHAMNAVEIIAKQQKKNAFDPFSEPSPDDIVLQKREGTRLAGAPVGVKRIKT